MLSGYAKWSEMLMSGVSMHMPLMVVVLLSILTKQAGRSASRVVVAVLGLLVIVFSRRIGKRAGRRTAKQSTHPYATAHGDCVWFSLQ